MTMHAKRQSVHAASERQKRFGCIHVVLAGFTLAVLLLVGSGIFLYMQIPKWWSSLDREMVPYLERKGRLLLGRLSMECLLNALEESGLSVEEKLELQAFLEAKWNLAWKSDDRQLSREVIIEESRGVVATVPGYYYAFGWIAQAELRDSSLSARHRDQAVMLLEDAREKLARGQYTAETFESIRGDILSVAGGWRVHGKSSSSPRAEHDTKLRTMLRYLGELYKQPATPAGEIVDMETAWRAELAGWRAAIEAAEMPQVSEAGAVVSDQMMKAISETSRATTY